MVEERERTQGKGGEETEGRGWGGPSSAGCHFFHYVSLLLQELSVKYYFKPDLIRENRPLDKQADESLRGWGLMGMERKWD